MRAHLLDLAGDGRDQVVPAVAQHGRFEVTRAELEKHSTAFSCE